MPINQIVDSTGTILNRYTLSEEGQTDRTVILTFNPSDDYVAGSTFSANTMNPIVNAVNALNGYGIWVGTQVEYESLAPDQNTLYFIEEE